MPTPLFAPVTTSKPAALNPTGPWLMLSWGTGYSGPTPFINPVITNPDGSAWEPLALPIDPYATVENPTWWMGRIAPTGGYLAMQHYDNEYYGECDHKGNPPVSIDPALYRLYFLKLPENKVVRSFQIIGLPAYQQIWKDNCNLDPENGSDKPPVLGVTFNSGALHWSPNGRYLAFSAAPDTPAADVFLYDSLKNTINRLTTHQNNARILGWSRDGKWIFYEGVKAFSWFHSQTIETSGLYAVTLDGQDQQLLLPESPENKYLEIARLSDTQLVVNDGPCPVIYGSCRTTLHLLDLESGTSEIVYKYERSVSIYSDPIHHLLLLQVGLDEQLKGVYQLDMQSRKLVNVLPDSFSINRWDDGLQAFRVSKPDVIDGSYQTCLFYYQESHEFTLNCLDYQPNTLSPDGSWYVKGIDEGWVIYNRLGEPVYNLPNLVSLSWSPDSRSLVSLMSLDESPWPPYFLYTMSLANNWEPRLARRIDDGMYWRYWWINP
jgi:hypothetical protein